MKVEDYILKRCGKESGFKVPEKYFDHLAQEIANKLPEKEKTDSARIESVSLWQKIRPWIYMAAMFAGMLVCIRFIIGNTAEPVAGKQASNENEQPISDEYIETMINQSMMDDYALYQYLTEAEVEINK